MPLPPPELSVLNRSLDQGGLREKLRQDPAVIDSVRSRFGEDYGVLLEEWRLLQRAVFVIAPDGTVAHAEYVADQMKEPDYDAALDAVRRLSQG